ncbi:MAG: hypothetical protein AAGD38_19520 [Acidobacteriota bacterium]
MAVPRSHTEAAGRQPSPRNTRRFRSVTATTDDAPVPAGLGWGDITVALHVAELELRLHGLSPAQATGLHDRYGGWTLDPSPNESASSGAWSIHFRPDRELVTPPSRYVDNGLYTPHMESGEGHVTIEGLGFRASIHLEPGHASTVVSRDEMLTVEPIIFENVLRVLTAFSVLARGGLLLHSAAVATRRGVLLFVGRSGAGKTTMSRRAAAAGYRVLSDDVAIVVPDASGYRVLAAPFWGEMRPDPTALDDGGDRGGDTTVTSMFWLHQGSDIDRRRLPYRTRLARLLVCCPYVNADKRRGDHVLESAISLLGTVPMDELSTPKNASFHDVIDAIEEKGPA